jgi:DNA-directed RNA polymerase subunit RPC12/RpoP
MALRKWRRFKCKLKIRSLYVSVASPFTHGKSCGKIRSPCLKCARTVNARLFTLKEVLLMRCPSCGAKMGVREGRHGPFYFCPNQHRCGQSTISGGKPDPDIMKKFKYRYSNIGMDGDVDEFGEAIDYMREY